MIERGQSGHVRLCEVLQRKALEIVALVALPQQLQPQLPLLSDIYLGRICFVVCVSAATPCKAHAPTSETLPIHPTLHLPAVVIRMALGNWSQLCTQQQNRPLWQLQQANYSSCIFAVSASP